MQIIESDEIVINNSQEKIYNFLSDFNNFGRLMPDQVINWKSTNEECSFTIKGMTDLSMRIKNKTPSNRIEIVSTGKAPFEFELICNIDKISDNQSNSKLTFKANMNPMLSMLASKPLHNFVNLLNQKLKIKAESSDF